jgi:hypothetical protein
VAFGAGAEPMARRRHPILRAFLILAVGVFGLIAR